MARFEHELAIDRPQAEVFAYLTDLGNLPAWQSGVVDVRRDEDVPLHSGATFTEVREVAGRRFESTIEVTALEPDSEFSLRVVAGPVPARVEHYLDAEGARTRIRVVGEVEGGGLRALARPVLERTARRQVRSDLERLKQVLEAGA